MEKRADDDIQSTDEVRDYDVFLRNNRKRVNRLLSRILWICILAGPAIALGVLGGVFKQTTYITCLVISLVMLALACSNTGIMKKLPYSIVPGVIALVGMELLLCYMNISHISIRLTWFLVPLLSLLFSDKKVYIGISVMNYVAMGASIWMEATHYADIRVDFSTPTAAFINVFAGCTIEAVLMFIAGFALGSLSGRYYRRMISEYAIVQEHDTRMQERMDILASMAEIYDYVNLIDFNESTEMSLREEQLNKLAIGKTQDHTNMTQGLKDKIAADMVDDFWKFTNIKTVPTRLINRRNIVGEFVNNETGWFRAQYIRVKGEMDKEPDVVIYTIQTIDADKRKEEHLIRISMTDELTRLFNRRCYEEDISAINESGCSENLVLISADVNGLKPVNDNLGHAAGDELIQGAAACLLAAVGTHGKAYRVGGDEFMAVVHVDDCQALINDIRNRASSWKGSLVDALSISVGYASHADYPDADIEELETIADKSMYEEKGRHYRQSGIDRRRR